jgi:Flp pilus assembly protein TadD
MLARFAILASLAAAAWAQEPAADRAYAALRAQRYEEAIALFQEAVSAGDKPGLRKDLAYTYLKIGENEAARDQFQAAMRLDPADYHAALEYAFLCFETARPAEARRVFDRIRQTGDAASRATAEAAFRNIDEPLQTGIARWQEALRQQPDDFSAHHELAILAERRDELELAATHYRRAWELKPERRSLLVNLGRALSSLGRAAAAHAALLAASRGGEPHAAEEARELLPSRYPYVSEFEAALGVDPANVELRRELAYLLLRMDKREEAESHFVALLQVAPEDLLTCAQLGFLYLARQDGARAMPLLEKVLSGSDDELSNRVRAVLRLPQTLRKREDPRQESVEAKLMAERSWKAGYLKDAQKYLLAAHESDPVDFSVMLRLGWVHNLLKQDTQSARWFNLARRSPDPAVSREAGAAYRNLRGAVAQFRTTGWMMPVYSSRWRDLFGYGQLKLEWKPSLPVRPYASMRVVGDAHVAARPAAPQMIFGIGAATATWHGATGWAEAGLRPGAAPDYRGGVAFARRRGALIGGDSTGWAMDFNLDAVYVSQFQDDVLGIAQTRAGYVFGPGQIVWNWNVTADSRRHYWANFAETGPGLRWRMHGLPRSSTFSLDVLRGVYLRNEFNPRRPNFIDFRTGFWYAFSY